MDGNRAIGGAGTTADHEYRGLSGQAGFRNGHEARAGLMPADDDFYRAVVKGIEKRQIAFARHAIDPFNAVGFQAFDDQVRGAHQSSPVVVQNILIDALNPPGSRGRFARVMAGLRQAGL